MDTQSSDSSKLGGEKATPTTTKEVLPAIIEETNSFRDCNRGLGALKPQEEMVKPESGNDREGSNNVLVDIIEETKNQGDN